MDRRRQATQVQRSDVFVGAHKGGEIYAACWCCQACLCENARRNLTVILAAGGRGSARARKDD